MLGRTTEYRRSRAGHPFHVMPPVPRHVRPGKVSCNVVRHVFAIPEVEQVDTLAIWVATASATMPCPLFDRQFPPTRSTRYERFHRQCRTRAANVTSIQGGATENSRDCFARRNHPAFRTAKTASSAHLRFFTDLQTFVHHSRRELNLRRSSPPSTPWAWRNIDKTRHRPSVVRTESLSPHRTDRTIGRNLSKGGR
jgi:hypothetical protein